MTKVFHDPSPRADRQRELIRKQYDESARIVTDAWDALIDQQPDHFIDIVVEWYKGTSAHQTALEDIMAGERTVKP